MTFCRNKVLIEHTHSVNNTSFKLFNNSIKDLVFIITCNLCPNMYIQIICCYAIIKILGFIVRLPISLIHFIKPSLFRSLMRPIHEYGSISRDPSTASARIMIEKA